MRIIVTSDDQTWNDTTTIRAALASVWDPRNVLVVAEPAVAAAALASDCWATWRGKLHRYPAISDRYGRDNVHTMRAAAMVASGAGALICFQHSPDVPVIACLADIAGIPVTTVFPIR